MGVWQYAGCRKPAHTSRSTADTQDTKNKTTCLEFDRDFANYCYLFCVQCLICECVSVCVYFYVCVFGCKAILPLIIFGQSFVTGEGRTTGICPVFLVHFYM